MKKVKNKSNRKAVGKMRKGRITIPTDENYVEGTKKIADLWGADAVRDCDGTHLPKNALEIADKVYNTYFVVRGDNAWADKHTDELQSVLLMTGYCLATEETLVIDLLKGYSHDQLGVNEENPKKSDISVKFIVYSSINCSISSLTESYVKSLSISCLAPL